MTATFAERYDNAAFVAAGFCQIPTVLLKHGATLKIEPDECWLLAQLLSLRYEDRPLTPTVPLLAGRMGKSEATIKRMVAALVARNIIKTHQPQSAEGQWAKSVYDLTPLFRLLDCCMMQTADVDAPTAAQDCAAVGLRYGRRSAKMSHGPERKDDTRHDREPERKDEPRTGAQRCATILESSISLQDSSKHIDTKTTKQDSPLAAVVVESHVFEKYEEEAPSPPARPAWPAPPHTPSPSAAPPAATNTPPEKNEQERTALLRLLRDKGVHQPGADSLLKQYTSEHLRAALACAPVLPTSYHNPGGAISNHIKTFDFASWQAKQATKVQAQAVRQIQAQAQDSAQEARRAATQRRLDALPADLRDAALAAAWGRAGAGQWPGEAVASQRMRWHTAVAFLPRVFEQWDADGVTAPVSAPAPLVSAPTGGTQAKLAADVAEAQERLAAQRRREAEKQAARKAAEQANYERVRAAAAAQRQAEEAQRLRRQGKTSGGSMSVEDIRRAFGWQDAGDSPTLAPQTAGHDAQHSSAANHTPQAANAPQNAPVYDRLAQFRQPDDEIQNAADYDPPAQFIVPDDAAPDVEHVRRAAAAELEQMARRAAKTGFGIWQKICLVKAGDRELAGQGFRGMATIPAFRGHLPIE